jgi:hypothetical protein
LQGRQVPRLAPQIENDHQRGREVEGVLFFETTDHLYYFEEEEIGKNQGRAQGIIKS